MEILHFFNNRIPLHLCFDDIVLFIRFILKYITFLVCNTKISDNNAESGKVPHCLQHFHLQGKSSLFYYYTKITYFFFNIKKRLDGNAHEIFLEF
jgi:hypothetical protein